MNDDLCLIRSQKSVASNQKWDIQLRFKTSIFFFLTWTDKIRRALSIAFAVEPLKLMMVDPPLFSPPPPFTFTCVWFGLRGIMLWTNGAAIDFSPNHKISHSFYCYVMLFSCELQDLFFIAKHYAARVRSRLSFRSSLRKDRNIINLSQSINEGRVKLSMHSPTIEYISMSQSSHTHNLRVTQ